MATESDNYTRTAKWLHWLMAVLLIMDLTFAQALSDMSVEEKTETLVGHSSLGLVLLTLVLVRLLWRLRHPAPALVSTLPGWQRRAAAASHAVLYALMVFVPLSGVFIALSSPVAVTPFGAFTLGGGGSSDSEFLAIRVWHEWATWLLIAFITLHFSAALYHRLLLKDEVLQRMTTGTGG